MSRTTESSEESGRRAWYYNEAEAQHEWQRILEPGEEESASSAQCGVPLLEASLQELPADEERCGEEQPEQRPGRASPNMRGVVPETCGRHKNVL
eukprot:7381866-Prymnesium_polylepis.3